MNNALLFKRMIGANTLYFWVDKMTVIALWRPLVKRSCRIFEYLRKRGSSLKLSTTNRMLNKSFYLFFFWKSIILCWKSMIFCRATGPSWHPLCISVLPTKCHQHEHWARRYVSSQMIPYRFSISNFESILFYRRLKKPRIISARVA